MIKEILTNTGPKILNELKIKISILLKIVQVLVFIVMEI